MTRHLPRRGALLALTLCLAPLAHAERLPAKLFAQNPGFSAVALSPDGKHLALTTPIENRTDLLIVDLSGKDEPTRIRYRANEHVIAPSAHSSAWVKARKQVMTPVEVLIKAGEAHGFYDEENRIELYQRMEAFLDQHIGTKAK